MAHIHSTKKQLRLTLREAADRFSYDPATGVLLRTSGQRAGAVAGTVTTRGYLHVFANGALFAAHRLCWLLHYGTWPKGDIDHINGNKMDNRISNLRSVTVAENNGNRPDSPPAKHYGFDRTKGLWRVHRKRAGRTKHLGYFKTEREAAAAAASL